MPHPPGNPGRGRPGASCTGLSRSLNNCSQRQTQPRARPPSGQPVRTLTAPPGPWSRFLLSRWAGAGAFRGQPDASRWGRGGVPDHPPQEVRKQNPPRRHSPPASADITLAQRHFEVTGGENLLPRNPHVLPSAPEGRLQEKAVSDQATLSAPQRPCELAGEEGWGWGRHVPTGPRRVCVAVSSPHGVTTKALRTEEQTGPQPRGALGSLILKTRPVAPRMSPEPHVGAAEGASVSLL